MLTESRLPRFHSSGLAFCWGREFEPLISLARRGQKRRPSERLFYPIKRRQFTPATLRAELISRGK
jgi:hypothetical protein